MKDPIYATWSSADLFPNHGENFKIFSATLKGSIGNITEAVRFDIYLHRGRLFSIEFGSELGALAALKSGLLIQRA
ncbi:hypothetical protein CJD38_17520 [Stenotrophobium rhamnosiphilum]|uniref:Uncharacterized protein n=1 Tax=Stenotrophobium rhamnosiphilum TaxID=2029166 RepID=A0A2T5MBQ4_9GAMM|nr:hypothetical protein CJD38_17520 [Stenotrophobium rhamnosiphilum]